MINRCPCKKDFENLSNGICTYMNGVLYNKTGMECCIIRNIGILKSCQDCNDVWTRFIVEEAEEDLEEIT